MGLCVWKCRWGDGLDSPQPVSVFLNDWIGLLVWLSFKTKFNKAYRSFSWSRVHSYNYLLPYTHLWWKISDSVYFELQFNDLLLHILPSSFTICLRYEYEIVSLIISLGLLYPVIVLFTPKRHLSYLFALLKIRFKALWDLHRLSCFLFDAY